MKIHRALNTVIPINKSKVRIYYNNALRGHYYKLRVFKCNIIIDSAVKTKVSWKTHLGKYEVMYYV